LLPPTCSRQRFAIADCPLIGCIKRLPLSVGIHCCGLTIKVCFTSLAHCNGFHSTRCFKTNPLDCTLLARWDAGYQDPWLILTDLPPHQADPLWYGLRSTTECVYRDIKSDGWRWQHTRLIDPSCAERVWLAIAVATLWMVFLGGSAESDPLDLTNFNSTVSASSVPQIPRQLSCFLRGLLTLLSDLLRDLPLHLCSWTTFPSTPVDSFYALNSS
jgi:hypothetical protein